MSQDPSLLPVPPHGGVLVDRIVAAEEADALRRRAASLPVLVLDARELADLELLAVGAASPLTGLPGRSGLRERRPAHAPRGRHGVAAALHPRRAGRGTRRGCAGTRGRAPRRVRPAVGHDRGRRTCSRAIPSTRPDTSTAPRTRPTPASPISSPGREHWPAGRCACCPCPRTCRSPSTDSLRARSAAQIAERGWTACRRLPDAQPDPSRARAPHEARSRVRGRARGPPARGRDEGRRRSGGGPLRGVRDAPRAPTTRRSGRSWPPFPRPCATPDRARRSSTPSPARTTGSPT